MSGNKWPVESTHTSTHIRAVLF